MSARLAARRTHALTAGLAACAVALTTPAAGLARPAGHGPRGAERERALMRSSGVAVTTRRTAPSATPADPDGTPDADGAATAAVILIAAGALVAGGGAGFAGARRFAPRAR